MVVVEGVARGLDPNLNIWQVAQPIVTDYVGKNVGPRALLRDLFETARVLARFGPKLPRMVEAALIAQADRPKDKPKRPRMVWFWQACVAVVLVGTGALLAQWF
jgi:ubiquinone biosynthesis protein